MDITDIIYPDILSQMKHELTSFKREEDKKWINLSNATISANHAYKEDVKNGYKGSSIDWVNDMRGYKGERGDTIFAGDTPPNSNNCFWLDTSKIPIVGFFAKNKDGVDELLTDVIVEIPISSYTDVSDLSIELESVEYSFENSFVSTPPSFAFFITDQDSNEVMVDASIFIPSLNDENVENVMIELAGWIYMI